jgi:hypothetical protein
MFIVAFYAEMMRMQRICLHSKKLNFSASLPSAAPEHLHKALPRSLKLRPRNLAGLHQMLRDGLRVSGKACRNIQAALLYDFAALRLRSLRGLIWHQILP